MPVQRGNVLEMVDEMYDCDTESISAYSFLRYMSEKNRTQFWLELIIDVMINPLCFIEGHIQLLFFIQENY